MIKNRYQVGQCLYQNSNYKLYDGIDIQTGDSIIIKKIDTTKINPEQLSNINKSLSVHKRLIGCNNILKLIESDQNARETTAIFEKYEIDLNDLLQQNRGKLSEDQSLSIIKQLLTALGEYSNFGYIPLNLKPQNIVFKNNIAKLVDLHTGEQVDGEQIFQSPQLLEQKPYSQKSVMWSIGLIAYLIAFGKLPWPTLDKISYIRNIYNTPLRFPYDIKISEEYKDFIEQCLQLEENARISIQSNHQLFSLNRSYSQLTIDPFAKKLIQNIQKVVQQRQLNIEQLYKDNDIDGNSQLDKYELFYLVSQLDASITTTEARQLFDILDVDGDQLISLNEFKGLFNLDHQSTYDVAGKVIEDLKELVKSKQMNIDKLFAKIDLDNSNELDFNEFTEFIRSFAPGLSMDSIKQGFVRFDKNRDNRITIDEFKVLEYTPIDPLEGKKQKILNFIKSVNSSSAIDNLKNQFEYTEKDFLGAGSFGKVYKGRDIKSGDIVAIKFTKNGLYDDDFMIQALQNEVNAMKAIRSPNVVQLYEMFGDQDQTVFVLEFCEGKDLDHFIEEHGGFLSEMVATNVVRQLMNGFKAMVEQGYIHRDIKPANSLIKKGVFKVADFGFATKADIHSKKKIEECVGTPLYMAPQLLDNSPYTAKCDIWSIGVMAYQMLTGVQPWPCRDAASYLRLILKIPLRFPYDKPVSDVFKDFIRQCLIVDESQRIGWDEVFQHPLLQAKSKDRSVTMPPLQVINVPVSVQTTLGHIQKIIQSKDLNVNEIFAATQTPNMRYVQFHNFLRSLDQSITSQEARQVMDFIDTDNSRTVSLEEFKILFNQIDFQNSDERLMTDLREIIKMKNYDLDQLFQEFDQNKNRQLDSNELTLFVRKIAPKLKDKEITFLYNYMDSDKDGQIDYDEFKRALLYGTSLDKEYDPAQLKAQKVVVELKEMLKSTRTSASSLFKQFDRDGSHMIEVNEFAQMVRQLQPSLTDDECKVVFKLCDEENIGFMTYSQFVKVLG